MSDFEQKLENIGKTLLSSSDISSQETDCYLLGHEEIIVVETFKLRETNVFSHLISMGHELLKYTASNITTSTDQTTVQNIKNILTELQIRFTNSLSGFCKLDQIPLTGSYDNLVALSLKVITGNY